jgi:hypothetical protein
MLIWYEVDKVKVEQIKFKPTHKVNQELKFILYNWKFNQLRKNLNILTHNLGEDFFCFLCQGAGKSLYLVFTAPACQVS